MNLRLRILFVLSIVLNSFGVGYFADKLPEFALLDGLYVVLAGIYAVNEMEPTYAHTEQCNCVDQSNCSDCGCNEGEDYMCPNCVTPWKCNGPHLLVDAATGKYYDPDPEDWKIEDESEW